MVFICGIMLLMAITFYISPYAIKAERENTAAHRPRCSLFFLHFSDIEVLQLQRYFIRLQARVTNITAEQ